MSNKKKIGISMSHIDRNELSIASKLIENGISMTPNFKLSDTDRKPISKIDRRFIIDVSKDTNDLPF